MTDDGNGQDQAQTESRQEELVIMALIVIDPKTGALGIKPNEKLVQNRVKFFHAMIHLALGNAMDEYDKQQSSKILVPKRQVARL